MKSRGILFGIIMGVINFLVMLSYKYVSQNVFDHVLNIKWFDMIGISIVISILWIIIIFGVINKKKN